MALNKRKDKFFEVLKFAIKNSGSLFVVKALGIAINYVVLLLVLHYFGFYGNGELAHFIAQTKGLMILLIFGLDIVLIKRLNVIDKNLIAIVDVGKALLVNFLLASVAFFAINLIVKIDYSFLVGGIILAIWRFCGHFYRGRNNMVAYGFFEFIVFHLSIFISIFISNYFGTPLIASIIYTNIVFIALFFIYMLPQNFKPLKESFSFNFKYIKNLYKESYHFVLSNSILIISTSVLYTIIKNYYSTEILGVYDSVLKFSLVIALPLIATNGRVMVLTSKYFNANAINDLKTYINKTTKMLAFISTICALGVIVVFFVYSEFINQSFKAHWLLFGFLIVAQLINNWAGPVGVVLQLTNNEKIYNLVTFATSIYLLLSTVLIANFLPIIYIAINYIIYMFLQNGISLLIVKKRLGINPYKI